jgi:hypothetical protein
MSLCSVAVEFSTRDTQRPIGCVSSGSRRQDRQTCTTLEMCMHNPRDHSATASACYLGQLRPCRAAVDWSSIRKHPLRPGPIVLKQVCIHHTWGSGCCVRAYRLFACLMLDPLR